MEPMQGKDISRWIAHSNHNTKRFTKHEIERITNNYRIILGRGASGEVYRGVLDKNVVAVKRLVYNVRENFDQDFHVHREVNHKNAVRLIGYCVEENALMMEYLPDMMRKHRRETLNQTGPYMYTQVIHGDIKPANILLDGSLKANISDFGISRLVNDPDKTLVTENFIGSIGYMDPFDVYSFGVVLVELITRKRAATSGGEGLRGVRALFDAEIASQNNTKILDGVAKLAGKCLLMERGRRPEMIDVVERLRKLGKASHQVHQRVDLFSWARKRKPMTTWTSNLCRQFSLEEIKAATRNFDESLLVNATRILPPFVNPDEIFGSRVYRGVIDGGATKVAIKLPSYRHGAGGCELRSAIEMRSKLRHGHIVPLIGYCDEDNETILVYDFMACVSLHYHLYENQQEPRLTWKQRLEICIGVARGLHYLHRGTKHAIIHGSLKSANIFLDKNWVAKIIDGGLSSDNASDHWVLSFNFLGVNPRDLTEESDVLAFGALLFEAQSRWALHYKWEGKLYQFLDPALQEEISLQSLNKFVETAARCVADQGMDRPSMADVLSDLECAIQSQVNAEASGSGS
ncbi:hypothetical protein PAHAL_8G209700 [Panicum hallii]|uniref:Protein kinase domain-containing protein n=1 Tax=Panicum hallii TaxID=206008 RepID=A0A2T8I9L1_9POAL|nr:hypothetical protein PAHAL_8G209700 [Panicum hallii]